MKLFARIAAVLILFILASPVILFEGCGGSSGACPDSVAPAGSTIVAPTISTAPSAATGTCYSGLGFTVEDSESKPMNGICIEITTNAAIALHTQGDFNCSNVTISGGAKTAIVTRTDDYGNVSVDLLTAPTTSGTTFFVEVASGAISNIATTPAAQ